MKKFRKAARRAWARLLFVQRRLRKAATHHVERLINEPGYAVALQEALIAAAEVLVTSPVIRRRVIRTLAGYVAAVWFWHRPEPAIDEHI